MKSLISYCLCIVCALGLLLPEAQAAKKKKKTPPLTPLAEVSVTDNDFYIAEISVTKIVKNKKKKVKQQISCMNTTPGEVTQSGAGKVFISYAEQVRYVGAKIKRLKAKHKVSASLNAKLAKFKKLASSGKKSCIGVPFNSLDAYKGTFGAREATRLARVSGFGAPAGQVAHLVSLGVDRAVDSIIDSNVSEPNLDAQMRELECDTYFAEDEENVACDPNDINDLDFNGMRTAYYHYALNTSNQLQAKLRYFIHDHVAASFRVLSGCEYNAARRYEQMVASFAQNGDLNGFLQQMVKNPLIAQWLNLYRSSLYRVNEDFGREFLELFTIGKHDLDGNLRYADAEIIASSRAFTGLRLVEERNGNYRNCFLAYSEDLHDPSPKTLWAGTPYQTVVYDAEDMIEAVKRHPGLAEFWANNLIHEFVTDRPAKYMVQEAAERLRKNGYNIKELLRVLLKSKAFYAEESRGTIYKLPIEFAFDILRTTGMPKPHPRWFLWNLDDLGQEMWNPPSVFGWYTYADNYMNSRYVLARRNMAMNLLDKSEDSLLEDENFDFFANILADSPSAEVLIDRLALQFGVSINPTQKAALLEFMNYYVDWRGNTVRDVFDSVRGSENAVWKTEGLMLALIEQVDFQNK